jgi:ferric enterobactin receptor
MKTIITLLLATVLSHQVISQIDKTMVKEFMLKGRVISVDYQAVDLATVSVLKAGDSLVMQTALTDTSGKFSLVVYDTGSYIVRVSAIGIKDSGITVTICRGKAVELPDIIVNSSDKQLRTATINANRPLIIQEADHIIYDLQADPQSKVSSVLDMMRKVPYLSVDGNDNVLLNGSSDYKIFINGRPAGLVESNRKDVLRSMPASTVKSIEVITSPSARYDADGLAGIININTIRQGYDGYRGSVNVYEKAPVGGPGAGGSLTFKQAKFGISALAGTSRYKVPETVGELQRSTTGSAPTNLYQNLTSRTNSHTAYAGLELSYEPDSLDLISGQFNWNRNRSIGLSTQISASTGINTQQHYRLNSNASNSDDGLDGSLNYQRGFTTNRDQLLTLSYQYRKDNSSLYNDISFSDRIDYTIPDYHQYNSENLSEHTAQVDYVYPIRRLTIEGGLKGIFRTNEAGFQYRDLNVVTGEYETDLTRSDIFSNSQDVLAAYTSHTWRPAGWQLMAGARVEETMIKIIYSNGSAQLRQNYLNVLPAVLISRKLKDNSSLAFSFSKRIQRPSVAELNPFVDRSNPGFETSGNPYLRPITSDAYQLSYLRSGKLTLNVSLGGLYFNHIFNAFPSFNPVTNITLTRYENYGRARVLKTNISLNYSAAGKWNIALNADIRHISVYGAINSMRVKNSGFGVYVYTSAAYSFKQGWRVNADFTYKMGGILLPLGRTNGLTASSLSINKSFIHSRLTISAAISNPFTEYRYNIEDMSGPDFEQTSRSQSYNRRVTFSLNYRFGKLKEEIKKNKKGIINDDIAN